jgi:hypothetical protein
MTTPHVRNISPLPSAHPSAEAIPAIAGLVALHETVSPIKAEAGGVGSLAVKHVVERATDQLIAA